VVRIYFGVASPGAATSGGTTFITKDVGFSLGPNGPGTLLLTGGKLLRNATIARTVAPVSCANARFVMWVAGCQLAAHAARTVPVMRARLAGA
jgi:hypothetical protein